MKNNEQKMCSDHKDNPATSLCDQCGVFMKNKLFFLVMLAFILAFGLVSCDKFIYKAPDYDDVEFTEMTFENVLALIPNNQQHNISGHFISDVVFVGKKDASTLTFETIDGSISKNMNTREIPEKIKNGQKVRIHYFMSSHRTLYGEFLQGSEMWGIYAIEKM